MAYKIKNKKKPKKSYYQKEVDMFAEKYAGHFPPPNELARLETRRLFDIPDRLHTKGQVIKYKGKLYVITGVKKKGIDVQQIKPKEGFAEISKNKTFISEKKLFEGEAYPHLAFSLS